MKRLTILALAILLLLAVVPVSAASLEEKYVALREAYLEFIEKGTTAQKNRRDLWMKHINALSGFQKTYPKFNRADDALYWVGDAYRNMYEVSLIKKDLQSSVKAYEKLIRLYPKSNLADDAALFIGRIYEEKLGDKKRAYLAYSRCCNIPKGDMGAEAQKGVERLAKYAPKPPPSTPTPEPTPAPTPEPTPEPVATPEPTPFVDATPATPGDTLDADPWGTIEASQVTPGGNGQIGKVDVWSNPDYTRIVVYTGSPVRWEKQLLPADPANGKPPRLFLDFYDSKLNPDLDHNIPVGDGLLKQVRVGQFQESVVRVVLDIQSIDSHRIFPMFEPFRVVIDVTGQHAQPQPQIPQIRRIVIDAGHGGKDPGAMAGGIREKDVALKIAKKTAANLRALGFEVIMTRNVDEYIKLEGRTAIANKRQSDLFISIHINASRRKTATGIETFHFAPRASKEDIALVAAENKTAHSQVEQMNQILAGIELGYKKMESNALAANVQREILAQLTPYSGTESRGVKSAPFYVLMGANMPAILVECGFITNPRDRKRLIYQRYQDRLATGITNGVVNYIRELDPDWKPVAKAK